AGRDALYLAPTLFGLFNQVRLVQHDHRLRAALPGHYQIPLDATRVVVVVESRDEEHSVDVGRDYLLGGLAPGGASRELAASRQYLVNLRLTFVPRPSDYYPVADRRKVFRPARE